MRLLVLGGTRFVSRTVAEHAVARGHEVTAANRGRSGPQPDGAAHMRWDRSDEAPAAVRDQQWDAVVDVARLPSHVRRAVAAVPDAHWVFVSTINVYPDNARPGTPATLPVHEPRHDDADLSEDPQAYGPMKVACEQAVTAGTASSTLVRPGLIAGPGDPTGRFTYWPARLGRAADGDEVLAPGNPRDPVQVIDVRDLADWILDLAEARTTGAYDGVGEVMGLGDLLARGAASLGVRPELTWVPQEFLESHGVDHWAGPQSVPLWLPRPDYDGMMAHDPTPSLAAGLRLRPVGDTVRDTWEWLRRTPDAVLTGLTADEEAEVLAAWHAR